MAPTPAKGDSAPALAILGTRGIPARHGGFETFAEHLALHLAKRGWDVTVYCQDEAGDGGPETWNGVTLRHLATGPGARGSILFDWLSLREAMSRPGRVLLILGYNTACFALPARLAGRAVVFNMDGLEWRRTKWSRPLRAWFRLNERLACLFGRQLIADHPAIAEHLRSIPFGPPIETIPYGSERIEDADPSQLGAFGVAPGSYALVIARPEPENSILEIVRAFSARPRGCTLLVLGRFDPAHAYQKAVLDAASPEVRFPGAVYEPAAVAAARFFARLYVHGHQVGGTNPSLVEALGAGNPVLAHDNPFNRWVAGPRAAFFADEAGCRAAFDRLLDAPDDERAAMGAASLARHAADFTWPDVLGRYEALLLRWARSGAGRPEATP